MAGFVEALNKSIDDGEAIAALKSMRALVIDIQDLPAGFQKGTMGLVAETCA